MPTNRPHPFVALFTQHVNIIACTFPTRYSLVVGRCVMKSTVQCLPCPFVLGIVVQIVRLSIYLLYKAQIHSLNRVRQACPNAPKNQVPVLQYPPIGVIKTKGSEATISVTTFRRGLAHDMVFMKSSRSKLSSYCLLSHSSPRSSSQAFLPG